jgi:hypothetical protein
MAPSWRLARSSTGVDSGSGAACVIRAEPRTRREIRIRDDRVLPIAAKGETGAICTPRQKGDICDSSRPAAVPTALSEQNPVRKITSGAHAIINLRGHVTTGCIRSVKGEGAEAGAGASAAIRRSPGCGRGPPGGKDTVTRRLPTGGSG